MRNAFSAVKSATLGLAQMVQASYIALLVLLLLFIVHQLFFWLDQEPEVAFNRAATAFNILEIGWDTTSVVYNAAIDIVNVGLLPMWNSAVYYILEPTVSLALEIFSIVFLRQSFPGVLPDSFGYNGVDCTASADAMAWCGRYDHYAKELESEENAPYYAAQSQTYKGMGEATAAARRALAVQSTPL